MATRLSPIELWRAIESAGGAESYIAAQMQAGGFVVKSRSTDGMSKRELAAYKKSLKAEAAEKRRLKKEVWDAYRENHIVHLGDGIFWNEESDIDKWDLDEPDARRQENDLPVLEKPKHLADALGLTVAELRHLVYHREAATSVHYRRFTIPKKSGGERAIWAPLPRLKAAQHWVLREIVEHLPVHGAAHGFLPARSILTNAAVHTDAKAVLCMDLKDFFPTVTFPRVKGIFRKAGYREQIATLLALLCTESPREIVKHDGKTYFVALGPRALPQGAPTSPGLTNALCMRLDRRLTGLAQKHGWRYTRYADDLTFSLPAAHKGAPHMGALTGGVKAIAAEEGFAVRDDKTRVARTGARQKVTGLVVNGPGGPRALRDVKRKVRAVVHNLEQGKPLREGETLAHWAGMAAFIAMSEPGLGKTLLYRLHKAAGHG